MNFNSCWELLHGTEIASYQDITKLYLSCSTGAGQPAPLLFLSVTSGRTFRLPSHRECMSPMSLAELWQNSSIRLSTWEGFLVLWGDSMITPPTVQQGHCPWKSCIRSSHSHDTPDAPHTEGNVMYHYRNHNVNRAALPFPMVKIFNCKVYIYQVCPYAWG